MHVGCKPHKMCESVQLVPHLCASKLKIAQVLRICTGFAKPRLKNSEIHTVYVMLVWAKNRKAHKLCHLAHAVWGLDVQVF